MTPVQLHFSTVFFVGLATLAVILFWAEFTVGARPVARSGMDMVPISVSDRGRQYSLTSVHSLLMECDWLLSVRFAAFQPAVRRNGAATTCMDVALASIRSMPTHGFAQLIAARAAAISGDIPAARAHLAKSVRFAPFEGWLAERRFAFVLLDQPFPSGQNNPELRHDLEVMLTTQSGAELANRFFRSRPATRQLIRSGVEAAAARDRQRFLNLLRKRDE